jgi:hypothetical protein
MIDIDRKRTYKTFISMKYRCYDPNHRNYKNYGERGVNICERWLDKKKGFKNFIEDMGKRPNNMQIDRIDSNGNYEKNNCRWVTASVNCANKLGYGKLKIKGVRKEPYGGYRAMITYKGKTTSLGTFKCLLLASVSFQIKHLELYNF